MPCSPGRLITGRGAIIGLDSHAPGLDLSAMSLHPLAAEFIAPCLPSKTDKLPSGSGWLHEIKHDGFRVIARKNGAHYSRARLASPRPSSPKRNNFSTTDSGRLFL